MTMMTADQRAAARDPAAFALRKLRQVQRLCGAGKRINDVWLVVNFAVYDLNLANARRAKRKPKRKSP